MDTLILNENQIDETVDLLKKGEIVAIPTETVYGIAADAFNITAVEKIFKAKGRPNDNPLIVHIANMEDLFSLVTHVPKKAKILAEKFWPGPLTMIFHKNKLIPYIVTAGLDYVAIRLPYCDVARKIISKLGRPLAAPSANLSGKPSPTNYKHVLNDLNGKISAILKGDKCSIGIESTVIDLTSDNVILLRPGKITPNDISKAINEDVIIDEHVNHMVSTDGKVCSPGIKYKHYSPNTKLVLVRSSQKDFIRFVNSKTNCVVVCFEEDLEFIQLPAISYGKKFSFDDQSRRLFSVLREIDLYNAKLAYIRIAEKDINLAIFNRLLRAAEFQIIDNPQI
ncbi:MAG: L-threonylcarbamoyladenylate synthase [Firmicutes bacterium]|nr:L-threonylcarbamoyladenylate synthase [Bacillota bacterium]